MLTLRLRAATAAAAVSPQTIQLGGSRPWKKDVTVSPDTCLFIWFSSCSVSSQIQRSLRSLGVEEEEEVEEERGGSGGGRRRRSVASISCVLGLADVVGRHVAPAAFCLAQPPLAVAVHVLELQDPQLLVGGDAQLVGTAGVEGVESVVNLEGGARTEHVRAPEIRLWFQNKAFPW